MLNEFAAVVLGAVIRAQHPPCNRVAETWLSPSSHGSARIH